MNQARNDAEFDACEHEPPRAHSERRSDGGAQRRWRVRLAVGALSILGLYGCSYVVARRSGEFVAMKFEMPPAIDEWYIGSETFEVTWMDWAYWPCMQCEKRLLEVMERR